MADRNPNIVYKVEAVECPHEDGSVFYTYTWVVTIPRMDQELEYKEDGSQLFESRGAAAEAGFQSLKTWLNSNGYALG